MSSRLAFCSRTAVHFIARLLRASFRQAVTLALVYALVLPATTALARPDISQSALGLQSLQSVSGKSATAFALIYDQVMALFTGAQGKSGVRNVPRKPPTKAERASRVARVEISPQGNEIKLQVAQPLVLIAVPRDAQGNVVQGLVAAWSSSDNHIVFIKQDGQAIGRKPGTAELTAMIGAKQAKVRVIIEGGSSKFYGGRKRTSKRADKVKAQSRNTTAGEAQLVNAVWSPDEDTASQKLSTSQKPSATSVSSRTHHPNFLNAALLLRAPDDQEDRLPDDETGSLYSPRNAVGAPPGKTEPGARTRAAATGGTELPGSSNFSFNVPVVSLPGRGLDGQMALVYNSQLWNKSTDSSGATHLTYDVDMGWPAPGFRLGFGQLEDQGSYGFTLVDPDGTRHQLIKTNPNKPNDFDSTDSTFIHFTGGRGWGTVIYPDGTHIMYGASSYNNPHSYPTALLTATATSST